MSDIQGKVTSLLARANDPGASEEERRTSATLAAKLMQEHGLTPQRAATPPLTKAPPVSDPLAEFRELWAKAEAAKSPEQRANERAAREHTKFMSDMAVGGINLAKLFFKK